MEAKEYRKKNEYWVFQELDLVIVNMEWKNGLKTAWKAWVTLVERQISNRSRLASRFKCPSFYRDYTLGKVFGAGENT